VGSCCTMFFFTFSVGTCRAQNSLLTLRKRTSTQQIEYELMSIVFVEREEDGWCLLVGTKKFVYFICKYIVVQIPRSSVEVVDSTELQQRLHARHDP